MLKLAARTELINKELISSLEDALDMAKSGEGLITGYTLVFHGPKGTETRAFYNDKLTLLGSLALLLHNTANAE